MPKYPESVTKKISLEINMQLNNASEIEKFQH